MRLARRVAKVLLTLILLGEAWFAWVLWIHGPPIVVTDEKVTKAGEYSFKVARVPASAHDWTVGLAVIVLQVACVGFLWWSSRKVTRS
jgi:hypothetical protein